MQVYDDLLCKDGGFLFQWKNGIKEVDVEMEFRLSGN